MRTKINQAALALAVACAAALSIAVVPCRLGASGQIQRPWNKNTGLSRSRQADLEFITEFGRLAPEARVAAWRAAVLHQGTNVANRMEADAEALLIAKGVDAAPYMAELLCDPREKFIVRLHALEVLSKMDRFIPSDELPKGAEPNVTVTILKLNGAASPFEKVSGKRIGQQAYRAIECLANQTEEKDLQIYARKELGLIENEFRQWSLGDQLTRWRDDIKRRRAIMGSSLDVPIMVLGKLIAERAPESLPLLAAALNRETDPYVREEIVELIAKVDARRLRLRKVQSGEEAIEAVQRALLAGNFKPGWGSKASRAAAWKELRKQFYDDELPLATMRFYADKLREIYGERTAVVNPSDPFRVPIPVPEFRSFITFLTNQDPFFPSWEGAFLDPTIGDESLDPRFSQKIERVDQAWKSFASRQSGS